MHKPVETCSTRQSMLHHAITIVTWLKQIEKRGQYNTLCNIGECGSIISGGWAWFGLCVEFASIHFNKLKLWLWTYNLLPSVDQLLIPLCFLHICHRDVLFEYHRAVVPFCWTVRILAVFHFRWNLNNTSLWHITVLL